MATPRGLLPSFLAEAPRAKALYDYESDVVAGGHKFLSFKTGDTIIVLEKRPDGWWKGLINNIEGLFPPEYCEELPPRRVLNVDTRKASPGIKRMQTLLKLTVTGTGEKIEEVEGEVVGRERAQSMWTERPKLAALQGDTMKGKILQREDSKKLLQEMAKLPDKVEATEPEIPQPVLPAAAELSRDEQEILDLYKRIEALETDKSIIMGEFISSREKLEEEYERKMSIMNEILDEKNLIIEIMKKDLEIKTEENKEISYELGQEIDKLTQYCEELALEVASLSRAPDETSDTTNSPHHDTSSPPSLPNPPNLPTPQTPLHTDSNTSRTPNNTFSTESAESSTQTESSQNLFDPTPTTGSSPSDPSPTLPTESTSPIRRSLTISIPSSEIDTPTPAGPPRPPRHSSTSSLPSLATSFSSLSRDSPRNTSSRPSTPRSLSSPRVLATTILDNPSLLTRSESSKGLISKFAESSAGNGDLQQANSPTPAPSTPSSIDIPTSRFDSSFRSLQIQLPAPPTPTGNAGSHPLPSVLPPPPHAPSTPAKSRPSSPVFPTTTTTSTVAAPTPSPSASAFTPPNSSLHSRPTRTRPRNKGTTAPVPDQERGEGSEAKPKGAARGLAEVGRGLSGARAMGWVQASGYMALGGLLFFLVESALHWYRTVHD